MEVALLLQALNRPFAKLLFAVRASLHRGLFYQARGDSTGRQGTGILGGAMSQENVEVVRRMYNAFHGGDIDGALSHFDPNVLVDASRARPDDVASGTGRERLIQIVNSWVEARWAVVYELDRGVITSMRIYPHSEEGLKAAGLRG